jgi:hypothetical protein
MLLETFHWDPGTLAKADIEMILPLVNYYPYWKDQKTQPKTEELTPIDKVDWL